MSSLLGECSLMKEISKTEEAIRVCHERVQSLERKIESDDIPREKKDEIQKELSEVHKLLQTNKDQLSQLHRHNRKSFVFVAAFCFICFTVYVLYILVNGPDF